MPRGKSEQTVESAIAKSMPVVTGLRCETCGKLHDAKGDTFMIIAGDIILGTDNPIVSNNIDASGRLVKATVLCRKMSCWEGILKNIEVAGTAKSGK